MKFVSVGLMAVLAFGLEAADTFRPVVRGTRGVVAAGHPLSAEAGMRILQQGGNAVDAGCAVILAASVIEFSHFSFGGEVPILIRLDGKEPVVINGQGTAPKLATREFFLQRQTKTDPNESVYVGAPEYVSIRTGGAKPGMIPSTGILPATVPAVLDAVVVALDQFGTKSLAEVMQPAIELADGFPVDEVRVGYIQNTKQIFARWPSTKKVFLPGGKTPVPGEIFSQRDLAATLRAIVKAEQKEKHRGRHQALMAARDFFYKGPVAQALSHFSEQNGGLLRLEDFASFHAKVEKPLSTTYREIYEVYKPGFWTQGPAMLEMLNMLETFPLSQWKHNSADYIHRIVEVMKLAFADRDRYYADPDFVPPPLWLLQKSYARQRAASIDLARASLEQLPGQPPPQTKPTASDTTCVNVIDRHGNLFSATPSGAWLPAVVAGDTGILLGQRMQSFVLDANHPNGLEPGKRPRITLTPTLVLKKGEPFLALSTPGGDNQDQSLLQVFLNIVEFGMNVQEAVEAPRFQTLHLVSSFDDHAFHPGVLHVEERISGEVIDILKERGHKVEVLPAWANPSAPTVVLYRKESGVIEAGADPRRGRYAIGW